ESETSYSFADQKVRPSDGSTEVSLGSPTRLSWLVAVPAFAGTGASIVPVGSAAIRSVTYIDQHSVEVDSSTVMPMGSGVLMSTDGAVCGGPPVPARAWPHWIRLGAPELMSYSGATTGTVEPATRPGRVAVR